MRKVSEAAIVKRIKRKLAHEGQFLHKVRGDDWNLNTSYYNAKTPYYVDNDRNHIVAVGVDLAGLGRELGVLSPDEYVEGWEEQTG